MSTRIRHESVIYTQEEWIVFLASLKPTKIAQSTIYGQKRPSWAVWYMDDEGVHQGLSVNASQARQVAKLTGLELQPAS
jgi:hypothetical protein